MMGMGRKAPDCLHYVGLSLWLPSSWLASKQAPPAPGIGWVRPMNSVPELIRAQVKNY